MGKPFFDVELYNLYKIFHDYCRDHACDEGTWPLNYKIYDTAYKYGLQISPVVAQNAINGPDSEPDELGSDDDRSSGAPTPRYHPADLYADESEELLLLETHGPGGPPAVLEE